MSAEAERKPETQDRENIVMDANLPEEIKSKLLMVLKDRRTAAQILVDFRLPELSGCGLHVSVIELELEPISDETKEMIRAKGILLAENDTIPVKHYCYFFAKDEQTVRTLRHFFEEGKFDLIKKIIEGELFFQ